MIAPAKRIRKTEEQKKHDHYLKLAILLRERRLHRIPQGVRRASFVLNGVHIDAYSSTTYAGYAYVVIYGNTGYECGCEHFEHRHSCKHTRDAAARAMARCRKLAESTVIAPVILGKDFALDLTVHVEDDLRSREHTTFLTSLANFFDAAERHASSQRRHMAPLNSNAGFQLMAPERTARWPQRQQETW